MLSWMLLEGEVIPADVAEARRWAEAAAEQGVASSMTRMGMLYHNLSRRGARRRRGRPLVAEGRGGGRRAGQAMLGAAHHIGSGVPRIPVTAYAWLLRAQAGGSQLAAPFMTSAREALSPEQLAGRTHGGGPAAGRGLNAMIIGTAGTYRPRQDLAGAGHYRRRYGPLKEEKQRGISIDLGFAYMPAGDGAVLASSTFRGTRSSCTPCWRAPAAIDFVVLVVAPQMTA